ncbi:hypothetical protein Fmac_009398 [Flemingia macrophylla]|uniref:TMV resistance protein N n=1 Tax=Flemingia macrophylla TaxID=520843 RepID=A0ABD1N042_9FABA
MEKLPPRYPNHRKGLVGIEKIYEEIKPLLKIGSDDSNEVITFGIWGMGGIGKTTLANALYEKLSGKFESCHFFANVTEKSEEVVHKDLYSKLSGKNISSYDPLELRLLLQTERVLIVLDDVTTPKKLEELIYQFYPLGSESRVIVTTRNKQIFRSDAIKYMVQGLKFHHSLELFWLTAFEEKQPKNGYEDISHKVVSYCKGVPLALKVVGASLRSKSKEVWECQMNKLQSIPNMEIQKVLKLSYDDLDDSQQSIFLDIACFLKGERRDNIFPIYEIEVLLDKSLITIQKNKNGEVIEMHDLIQEMGNEIVRQESIKYPERRSRLWKHEEVVDVLKKNKENDIVEGIILNLELLNENLNLSNDFLAKMINLRFFKIYKEYYWIKQEQFNIYLHDNLESLSDKLRYFHWDNCCLKSLPSKFCAEQLVVLIMLNSKLKKLWDGVQNLCNLKEIDLRGSKRLTNIPDLSKATKLVRVNLSECRKIKSLNIHSKYLSELYLDGCLSLAEISVTSDKLTRLNLCQTSLFGVSKLKSLNVNSRPLKALELPCCSSLKEIAVVSDKITALTLRGSAIASLPSSISSLSKLTRLDLSCCRYLVSLPELPPSLRFILLDNCWNLVSLPELPSSLDWLSALNCNSLETEMCQRLVLQQLLRPNSYGRDSKYFVFPGNHVIEECEFHTTEHSMSIPASCLNISHLSGFIFCIFLSNYVPSVLGREIHNTFDEGFYWLVDMLVSIYEDDTQLWHARSSPFKFLRRSFQPPISDHMMFGYHDLSEFDGMSEVYHPSRDVRIIFQLHVKQKYGKRFGVFPVYATTSGFELQISESQSIQPKQPLHQRGEGLNQKL